MLVRYIQRNNAYCSPPQIGYPAEDKEFTQKKVRREDSHRSKRKKSTSWRCGSIKCSFKETITRQEMLQVYSEFLRDRKSEIRHVNYKLQREVVQKAKTITKISISSFHS